MPVALKPPASVAESVTIVPTTGVVVDNNVVRVGLALLTVNGSHAEVDAPLFPSPEYAAFQLNDPAELNV